MPCLTAPRRLPLLLLTSLILGGCAASSTPRSGLFAATRADLSGISTADSEAAPPCPGTVLCLLDLPLSVVVDLLMLPLDLFDLPSEHTTPPPAPTPYPTQ